MMKKFMFFALASAAMLASCSSDDTIAVDESNVAADGPVAIQIGVGQIASATTRGTGTVGDTVNSAKNVWAGQSVYVYMFNKGSLNLTVDPASATGAFIYDNQKFVTKTANDTVVADPVDASDNAIAAKYYPSSGASDFWGYRLDGANTVAPAKNAAGTQYTVDFTIDGSQDIMVGKANPDASEIAKVGSADRCYSAYSARRSVQPNITFKHLLTRLTFTVRGGTMESTDANFGVKVDSIKVISKNTGNLIVAYTGDEILDKNRIAWNDPEADLWLQERSDPADANAPLQVLTANNALPATGHNVTVGGETKWLGDSIKLGEALLVAPANSYEMVVCCHQNTGTVSDPVQTTVRVPLTIERTGGAALELGHTYNVDIIIYGLTQIVVNTTLTGWIDGGTLPFDTEALGF